MSTPILSYAYTGRNDAGKLVKGKLEAPSQGAVAAKLRTMGLSPVKIDETVTKGLNREITIPGFRKSVRAKDLAVVSRQMATMIGAGLTLLRTLSILAGQTENKTLAADLAAIGRQVESGSSLSEAMRAYPRDFPPLMVNMIRAGETGGFLDSALESIATNFEDEAKLRSTITSAMTYPVVVLVISLVSVVAMLLFVVPVFKKMFEGLGSALPLPTQMLVTLSASMVWLGPLLAVLVIAVIVWWQRNKHEESVRRRIDPVLLKLPVFGILLRKIAISRFSRNLQSMIGAGVPILQALRVVGEASGNWVIENAASRVAESVRQGRSLAAPLTEEPVFPEMVTQMIAVGEDSGALETMLGKIADFYDAEVAATTKALTSLIEPLLIVFLGSVIGSMVVALYLPIFHLATAVQNSG